MAQLAGGEKGAGGRQGIANVGVGAGGGNETGDNGVGGYAVAGQAEGKGAGQLEDAAFGAAVGINIAAAAQAKAGGYIDDFALAAVNHGLGYGTGAVESAAQIDIESGLPLVIAEFPNRRGDGVGNEGGVVNQHIHIAEVVEGGSDEIIGLGGVADIGGDGKGAAAEGGNFVGGGCNGRGTAAGDNQVGAGFCQVADHFQAQAGAAAGDDDNAPVKVEFFQRHRGYPFLVRREVTSPAAKVDSWPLS